MNDQRFEEMTGLIEETIETSECSAAEAQRLWQTVLGELQLQMTRATFDTWLRGSQAIGCDAEGLTVQVRHSYAVDWLQNRLLPVIQRTVRRHAGATMKVRFTDRGPAQDETLTLVPEPAQPEEVAPPLQAAPSPAGNGRDPCTLNPRYTFDGFVVGAGNRLAHAASLAVAENPSHAYNPLFLYGGAGLGKTHLLHALGHAAQERGVAVLYVSSEGFTNDLINAIRRQETDLFRSKYRTIDMLLVDDIQFIVGKERTQEEFFHTFNTLHSAGKQIVISCDRAPRALVALEDRLRSRFGWGLAADIQPPDFETRVAILRAKAENVAVQVPVEVTDYIARQVPSNIRELEGALNRVLAHTRLMGLPLTLTAARATLGSIVSQSAELSPGRIISAVARYYGVPEKDLLGPSRQRTLSVPRQLCMYIIRQETHTSLPQIGEILGGRDHSTILHGCAKIGAEIESDQKLRRDWLAIREMLSSA